MQERRGGGLHTPTAPNRGGRNTLLKGVVWNLKRSASILQALRSPPHPHPSYNPSIYLLSGSPTAVPPPLPPAACLPRGAGLISLSDGWESSLELETDQEGGFRARRRAISCRPAEHTLQDTLLNPRTTPLRTTVHEWDSCCSAVCSNAEEITL